MKFKINLFVILVIAIISHNLNVINASQKNGPLHQASFSFAFNQEFILNLMRSVLRAT